jgi:hypothetical protein
MVWAPDLSSSRRLDSGLAPRSVCYCFRVFVAQFFTDSHDAFPREGASALVVEVSKAGAVCVRKPDGSTLVGELSRAACAQLLAYADECDLATLGSSVGVGSSWIVLSIAGSKLGIRHRGAPGQPRPDAWTGMPKAKPVLLDLLALVGLAALEGKLASYTSGLPDPPARISKLGLLMRAQISHGWHSSKMDAWSAGRWKTHAREAVAAMRVSRLVWYAHERLAGSRLRWCASLPPSRGSVMIRPTY